MFKVLKKLPSPLLKFGSPPVTHWEWWIRWLPYLRELMPLVFKEVMKRRCKKMLRYWQMEYPEVYTKLKSRELPDSVREPLLDTISSESLNTQKPPQKRIYTDILYITGQGAPDIIKEIIALKRVNPDLHCTLVTRSLGYTEDLSRCYFEQIQFISNYGDLISVLLNTEARVVIVRRGGHIFYSVLTRLLWNGRMIYHPSGWLTQYEVEQPGYSAFQAEKYVAEKADGIFHFFSSSAIERLTRDGMNIICPVETIYPGCVLELRPKRTLPKLSGHDGKLHLVHAHGIGLAGADPRVAGPAQNWDKWRKILEQGIHIHAYVTYVSLSDPGLSPYWKLAEDFSNFHIEERLQYNELLVSLTQYDYALIHGNFEGSALKQEFWYFLSNNFFAYLDAGLPVIVSPSLQAHAYYASTLRIGVVVPEEEISQLKSILTKQDIALFTNNVKLAQTKFEIDHHKLWNLVMPI